MSGTEAADEAGIVAIAAAVRAGDRSAEHFARRALERISRGNAALNAFTDVYADAALHQARAVDAALAAGRDPGPLAGVPFAVKNLFDVEGRVTRAGSLINRDRAPAGADATAIARLRAAGAVLVGSLNMDEYAFGFTTENSHDGPTRNPHDPARVAGGSSGGSAAAVAAGLVPLTLGSDTNGSIRVPSSFCGIFGLKPTYGRLSRRGAFLFSASLDHVGPFARSSADLAAVYDILQGPDAGDPVCAGRPVEAVSGLLGEDIGDLRLALAGGHFHDNALPEAREALRLAAAALGVGRTVDMPEAGAARAAAALITFAEAGNLHLDSLRTRPRDFDPLIRDRLLAGALLPANWLMQAQRMRRRFRDAVARVFESVDVILAPATPCPAIPIGSETMVLNGVTLPARAAVGILTQPLTLIGLPIAVAPIPRPGALPLGIQIIAPPWREDRVLRVAAALERHGIASAPIAPINPSASK